MARRQGYDLDHDAHWWRYVQVAFAGGFAQNGLDVSELWPFAEDGTPLVDESQRLAAEVNHGRWLTVCPCGDASLLRRGNDLHICLGCGNDGQDAFRRVAWPVRRNEIERALLLRPRLENRNWSEPETVEDLLSENAERL